MSLDITVELNPEVLMAKMRNRIPAILKERDMTITDLQTKSGLPWPTVHKVATERVRYIPDRTSIKTLRILASVLGVEIGELFETEGE